MNNKENEIKRLFDYSDLLVIKKTKKVLRYLEEDKKNIINGMERRELLNSGFLFKKLIDRDLEGVEEIVNYQVDCDLNEISLPLTKSISDKIYLRAKSCAENGLNILNSTLRKYGRFWNENERLIILMKSQYNNKIAHILDDARLEIKIHQEKFDMEISNPNKIKVIKNIITNNQESYKIEESSKDPKIFLSYSHKNKEIADRIDKFFISKNIRLTRDVRDALPYSSLKKFMDTIRDHDYVILLISDEYLKSTNCMYEVIQFIQERNYIDRTFPIVIDNEATIFDQPKHSKYIHYWQKKYKELGDKIKTLQNTGTISLHKELDKINKIQSNIGEFLNDIADLKCFTLDELESTNYKAILDKIGNTFSILQKEKIKSIKDENIWDKDWIMKRHEEAILEMKKNDKLGFVEIIMTLTNPGNNKFECEKLKETFKNTALNNNQWPLGYLEKLISIYPKNDGIFFEIKDYLSNNLYLYGYIREDGVFYLIHSLFEDVKEYFDYIFCESRIDRIVKALLFSIQFYQNLNIKPNSYMLIGIKHGGLKNRCLVHNMIDVRFHDPTLISTEDENYYEEKLILNKIEEQLAEIVERFSNKLFKLFNFYQVDKKDFHNIIEKIIS